MRAIVFRIFFLSQFLFCLPLCSSEFPSFLSICEVKKTGGLGTKANPFWICDYVGLNNIRNNLSSSYTLLADIDASSTCGGSCASPSGMGWPPIGISLGMPFTGQFNGNTHTISNLYLKQTSSVDVGLFGVTDGAEIRELGLVNINIVSTGDRVGGLVARLRSSRIIRCYTTGSVSLAAPGGDQYGGLVGQMEWSRIINSYSEVNINGVSGAGSTGGNNYGGLVGRASSFNPPMGSSLLPLHSFVIGSYATGNIMGNGDSHGGLVGDFDGEGSVANSYATGDITGGGDNYGGLIGQATSTSSSPLAHSFVIGSYATGNIMANGNNHGGLVGDFDGGGTVANSYATGDITGSGMGNQTGHHGGLVGQMGRVLGIGLLQNNYASGNVTTVRSVITVGSPGMPMVSAWNYGGLVGYLNGIATNNYATGDVSDRALTSANNYGGLIGIFLGSKLENSYTTGSVITPSTGSNIAGLIGLSTVPLTGFHYFVDGVAMSNGISGGTCGAAICERQTVANIREVTSSSAPGAWSTGSTQWNLDYGNNSQLPAIKHVQNPSPTGPRWCNDGSRNSAHLPVCGSIISGQR